MSVHKLQIKRGLVGEADHRIANSLATISSLVRVRASSMSVSDNPRLFLLEIADRIETVAALHRLMAQSDSDEVQIGRYLHKVCDKLDRAFGTARTSLTFSSSADHAVPSRVALPLGLMTGELFSNSLKYAHPTGLPVKVTISCESDENGIRFTYDDDGIGFPENFDFSRDGNLGLRFIHSLVSQLGGTHEWTSDPLGVRFELRIPSSVLCGKANVAHGNFSNDQKKDVAADTAVTH